MTLPSFFVGTFALPSYSTPAPKKSPLEGGRAAWQGALLLLGLAPSLSYGGIVGCYERLLGRSLGATWVCPRPTRPPVYCNRRSFAAPRFSHSSPHVSSPYLTKRRGW